MPSAAVQKCGNLIETYLCDWLCNNGVECTLSPSKDLLSDLRSAENGAPYSVLILSSEAPLDTRDILRALANSFYSCEVKVILLTSFDSWGGKSYREQIVAPDDEFIKRVPLTSAMDVYKVENELLNLSKSLNIEAYLVATGLLYGGEGFHWKPLFETIWNSHNTEVIPVVSGDGGHNRVPMIHYSDLIKLVGSLVTGEALKSFFIPAVDGSEFELEVVLRAISRTVSGNVKVVTPPEAHEAWLNDKHTLKSTWNLDLYFPSPKIISLDYAHGLYKCAKDVWSQYRTISAPTPRSAMLAGPPSSLKSTIAKALADKWKVSYVDLAVALKYVLDTQDNAGASSQSDLNDTLDLSEVNNPVHALKIELCRFLIGKLSDPKKKLTPEEETQLIADVKITADILDGIREDLLKKCLAVYLETDLQCSRKGYVLDAWGTAIKQLWDVQEITNTLPAAQCDNSSAGGSMINSVETRDTADTTPAQLLPQLIIELQCSDQMCMERYIKSLGLEVDPKGKYPKEHAANIKALETKQLEYNKRVVQREDSSASHEIVCEMEKVGYKILRLSTQSQEFDLEASYSAINNFHEAAYGKYDEANITDDADMQEVDAARDVALLRTTEVSKAESEQVCEEKHDIKDISQLEEEARNDLMSGCQQLQDYLVQNVLPHVAEGIIHVAREKVADPLQWMATFLQQRGNEIQSRESQAAYDKFMSYMAMAEEMESHVADRLEMLVSRGNNSE